MTRVRVAFVVAWAAVAYGLYLALTAPPDALQGEYARIISVHVPAWWNAFLAFAVTAFGSAMWLIGMRPRWDRLASAAVEIGVLFTGIGLVTGMIWGDAVWGVAWDWGDPRLMTSAVMFFVYLGYLALRSATDDHVIRARRSAILGMVAVIQVPLVYFSVNMFRTIHQTQSLRPDGSTIPEEMLTAMLVNVAAFTLLFIALMVARLDVATAEETKQRGETLVGVRVEAPRIEDVGNV